MNILWLIYVHMLDKPLGVEFLHQRMCAFKILTHVAKLASKTATSVSGRDTERYTHARAKFSVRIPVTLGRWQEVSGGEAAAGNPGLAPLR